MNSTLIDLVKQMTLPRNGAFLDLVLEEDDVLVNIMPIQGQIIYASQIMLEKEYDLQIDCTNIPTTSQVSQLQSKLSAEKIPAEQCDQHLNYKDNSISRRLPGVPVGALQCAVWVTKVKNIQDLSDTLFVFEIFLPK